MEKWDIKARRFCLQSAGLYERCFDVHEILDSWNMFQVVANISVSIDRFSYITVAFGMQAFFNDNSRIRLSSKERRLATQGPLEDRYSLATGTDGEIAFPVDEAVARTMLHPNDRSGDYG